MREYTLPQRVQGIYIAKGAMSLPVAATDSESFRSIVIDVPEIGKVELTFKRMRHKKVKKHFLFLVRRIGRIC